MLDTAAPSHKPQVVSSLSTAQYLSSTLGESFFLLHQNILVSKPKPGGPHPHRPHIVPTPESSPMCETPQLPTLGGDTMSTKENFFSRTTRHILLPESWKRENTNNSSTHLEKNGNGEGEMTVDQVQGGSGGDHHYTTATHLNNESAEVTKDKKTKLFLLFPICRIK